MGKQLTEDQKKALDIRVGKEHFMMYVINTFGTEDGYIKNFPPIIDCCLQDFFNEYGYTAGNKIVEIDQLRKFHEAIVKEMGDIMSE